MQLKLLPSSKGAKGTSRAKAGSRKSSHHSALPSLDKPTLQTSGKLRIIHIKKFLIQKLKLESIPTDAVSA